MDMVYMTCVNLSCILMGQMTEFGLYLETPKLLRMKGANAISGNFD